MSTFCGSGSSFLLLGFSLLSSLFSVVFFVTEASSSFLGFVGFSFSFNEITVSSSFSVPPIVTPKGVRLDASEAVPFVICGSASFVAGSINKKAAPKRTIESIAAFVLLICIEVF